MAKWYLNLKTEQRAFVILAAVAIFGFLCQLPLFFFHTESGYPLGAYPLGWLLGSAIELFGYATILKMSGAITSQKENTSAKTTGAVIGFSFLRFLFYAAALMVSAICTFTPNWFGGFNAFNFYTTAAGLVPLFAVVLITQKMALSRSEKNPEEKK